MPERGKRDEVKVKDGVRAVPGVREQITELSRVVPRGLVEEQGFSGLGGGKGGGRHQG